MGKKIRKSGVARSVYSL